jgi:hypothetical protein
LRLRAFRVRSNHLARRDSNPRGQRPCEPLPDHRHPWHTASLADALAAANRRAGSGFLLSTPRRARCYCAHCGKSAECARLREAGKSIAEVARLAGVGEPTLRKAIAAGWPGGRKQNPLSRSRESRPSRGHPLRTSKIRRQLPLAQTRLIFAPSWAARPLRQRPVLRAGSPSLAPCLLPTPPHGDAVGTVFGAEPSNCTDGTRTRKFYLGKV